MGCSGPLSSVTVNVLSSAEVIMKLVADAMLPMGLSYLLYLSEQVLSSVVALRTSLSVLPSRPVRSPMLASTIRWKVSRGRGVG